MQANWEVWQLQTVQSVKNLTLFLHALRAYDVSGWTKTVR